MFFGNDGAKDKKIAELEARIKELESKQSTEDILIEEINSVLSKATDGVCTIKVDSKETNSKIEQIKDSINCTVEYYKKLKDDAIKELNGKLSNLFSVVDISSSELSIQTKELSSSSNTLSHTSSKQTSQLEDTSTALEEVTTTVTNNSENTTKMSSFAQEVIKSAKNGQDMSNETDKAMDEINEQVSSINEAITIIDQIAFQTNILSLNAAVEAATAGEAGKGFAVVAGEVRNLANRSAEAAKEIKELVENATEKTVKGKEVAYKMTQGYEKLYENINSTIELINNVSNTSKEQKQAIEQINNSVMELNQVAQENVTAASKIESQSGMIEDLSQKLVDTISNTKNM